MAERGLALDPLRNFKFRVSVGFSDQVAGFSRVSGLKEQTEVVEYREGTDPARMRKMPGQTSWDNVVLERGLTNSMDLVNWRRDVSMAADEAGKNLANEAGAALDFREEVTIELAEYHARVTWIWTLVEAWPASLEIGEFAHDGNDVVLETLELAHEGIRVQQVGG